MDYSANIVKVGFMLRNPLLYSARLCGERMLAS